jgi:DNA-directed RNA polymerase specialized sigma24 family protein
MEWLGEIAKHHKDYVRTINKFGEYFYAEDLVQEMYLRLDRNKRPEDIIVDGKINQYFIHLTLKSIF